MMVGFFNYKRLDLPSKLIPYLLGLTFIAEASAFYIAIKIGNNMFIYQIFNPIEFLIISCYFNFSISAFKRNHIGIYIGIFGIILGILNAVYLQPINTSNYYFLVFEGLSIVFMALYSFNRMFLSNNLDLLSNPHFWFSFILLTFWSITYTYWGMHEMIDIGAIHIVKYIGSVLMILNIITYSGFGFILFHFFSKKVVLER